ncbi:MAG: DUF1080 domain-containing protein [Bacteroidetes bacterium]|nr:MAG: DUF1080 domain-containing protein [Bacteroidota bacterium]
MRAFFYFLCALLIGITSCQSNNYDPDKEAWRALFNGKDLSGWTPKITGYEAGENFGNTFRVEDSLLTVSYVEYDSFRNRFGHLFTNDKFSYYRLLVEYRFVGEQAPGGEGWAFKNSGAMLHSQSAASMLKDQDFPISIEGQFLGGREPGQPRPTMNLCTPGTHVVMGDTLVTEHCIDSSSPTFYGEEWVRAEFLVLGDSLIRHYVNGEPVLEYYKPQYGGGVVHNFDPAVKKDGELIREGHIALQSESHPIQFRRVELLDLCGCTDPKARNYKSYYVKSDPSKCIYD